MPTFLRALFVRTLSPDPTHALAPKLRRSPRSRYAFLAALLLSALSLNGSAQALKPDSAPDIAAPAALAASHRTERKRLIMLRRHETQEGARLTLTSDAPLGDYRSFAEGERVCVMIPHAGFVSARGEGNGRGFADMRIEQRDENVMLCFRLQQGATVGVNQNFNRLDVVFMTNEQANFASEN
jgi:hypothetical protein